MNDLPNTKVECLKCRYIWTTPSELKTSIVYCRRCKRREIARLSSTEHKKIPDIRGGSVWVGNLEDDNVFLLYREANGNIKADLAILIGKKD